MAGPSISTESIVKTEVVQNPEAASLLITKPLKFDDLLSTTRATANYHSLARSISTAPISALSANALRGLANIITRIQSQIQAIRTASKAIENHLDLCAKEFHRQIRAVKQCQTGIQGLRDNKAPVKIFRMLERQEKLAERLDKVLGAMSSEYQPELAEVERKWLDELERLKEKVEGPKGVGLVARTQGVCFLHWCTVSTL